MRPWIVKLVKRAATAIVAAMLLIGTIAVIQAFLVILSIVFKL